jgi:iron(III) transport system permease protein
LGCIAGSTRCGVAWNTLVLAFLCATGCTALGLAFALIATRTAFRYKARCASLTILPIITPPFVIGLGLILIFGRRARQPDRSKRCSDGSSAAGSTGCRACSSRRCSRSRPIAFLVLIGVVEGVSPEHGRSRADAARRPLARVLRHFAAR